MKKMEIKQKNSLPDWQLNKIRTIIENRWDEVWPIVVERKGKIPKVSKNNTAINFNLIEKI